MNFDNKDYAVEIKTVDAQESYEKEVIVLVTGCLTGNDNLRRKFMQTIFLAPQDNGFFVLSDVYRYIEENEQLQTNIEEGSVVGDEVIKPLTDASQNEILIGA